MAVGSYGTIRPADVSPQDVEILLHYAADRGATTTPTLKKLDSADILTPVFHNGDTGGSANNEILGGLYNLRLNSADFGGLGYYTLHLRPIKLEQLLQIVVFWRHYLQLEDLLLI